MKNVFVISSILSFSTFSFGQVGINTSNPLGTIHVDGAKDNPASGTPSAVQQANDLILTSAGNLGVGITSPANKFHVVASTPNSGRFTLIDAQEGTLQSPTLVLRNTSPLAEGNYSILGFNNSGPSSNGANWGIGSVRTATNEDFFMGNSLGAAYLERFRITSAGNVGIATSTPNYRLEVIGANTLDALALGNSTLGSCYRALISAQSSGSEDRWMKFNSNWTTTGNGTRAFGFFRGTSEYLTILDNGTVGVGTATPTARLEISSGSNGISGLKFTNMNSSSTPSTNVVGLAVDATGNVVVAAPRTGKLKNSSECFCSGDSKYRLRKWWWKYKFYNREY